MGKTVLDARVVDIEKRRYPSKHYVYVIEVSWSEGTTTTVYRRYSTFYEFQCGLLEKFPVEAGFKNPEERMIPFLPGKKLFGRSQVRSVASKRMAPIDDYCQKLIRLPPKISDSDYVINFFEVKPEDISPPTKKEKEKKKKSEPVLDISDPMVLDQYIVIADYQKQKNSECSISAGQIVEVIDKNENGWWFVHMDDFNEGWIPATYLEPVYGVPSDGHQVLLESGEEEVHITTSKYQAKNPDELSFERGVLMEVYMKGLDGWWKARYQNSDGFVPACYLTRYYGTLSSSTSSGVQMVSTVQDAVDSTLKPNTQPAKAGQGGQLKSLRSASSFSKMLGNSAKSGVDPYTDEPIYVPTPRKHNIKKQEVRRPPLVTFQNSPKAVHVPNNVEDNEEGLYEEPGPPTEEVFVEYEAIPEFYKTLAEFRCDVEDGLSFKEGVTVSVITKNPSGWYYVEMGDKEGWVPSSYLERTTQSTTKAAVSPTNKEVAEPRTTSFGSPLSPVAKPTGNKWSSSSPNKPVISNNRKVVPSKPSIKERPSENEVQPSSVSALASVISNLKPRPQDTEQNAPTVVKSPPPKPQRPSRSRGENKPSRTRGSLVRSSSSDALYESTKAIQVHRNCVSPPQDRMKTSMDLITSKRKPTVKINTPPTRTQSSVSKPTKFLRKSEENILAALDNEEKQATLKPEVVPRKGTFTKPKSPESVQEKAGNRPPKPAQRSTAQSMRPERPRPGPPPARTAKSYHPQVTGTMRLAELENALQNKRSEGVAVLISKPTISKKTPTRPTPPSSSKVPPKRPQPPTSSSADKSKKVPPPRPSYSPALSRTTQESYVTIANYIGDDSPGSLGFKEGMSVEVIEKSDDGWWFVQIKGKEGWVPSTFLEKTSGKPERPKPPRPSQPTLVRTPPKTPTKPKPPAPSRAKNTFVAIGDYTPAAYEDSGIALVEGETYKVIEKSPGGWWFVSRGNQEGWAPSSFLESV